MRCLLILFVFFLFSVTPNVPQVRTFSGQRPAEEEIAHAASIPGGVERRDASAEGLKFRIKLSPRRLTRPSSAPPLLTALTGHRLANGLLAPILQ
jgi:hypothetical protein